jgi:hypothetical protein
VVRGGAGDGPERHGEIQRRARRTAAGKPREAVVATLPLGSVGFERGLTGKGEKR